MANKQTELAQTDLILGSIANGVFAVDKDFKITLFNKAAETITGWKAQEVMGKRCNEAFRTDLCESRCVMQQAMKEQAPSSAEAELKTKDGRPVTLAVIASAIKDEKGNLFGGAESFQDITESKRLAEELAVQQRKVIEELSTPVIRVWDKVLTVPLIGTLDSPRTQLVMETLLQRIVDTQSRVVILDISGIPGIDTQVANHLISPAIMLAYIGRKGIVHRIEHTVKVCN
ncbi:hypothetical protein ES703_92191 [subsurface metagenome]